MAIPVSHCLGQSLLSGRRKRTYANQVLNILRQAETQPKARKNTFNLKVFVITDFEWEYLQMIRENLEIFLIPTKVLQGQYYGTSNLTISFV